MYPNIPSLIYVLLVLHISCAAIIVKDPGTNYVPAQLSVDNLCKDVAPGMAVPVADTQDGRLWITAVHDEIIPSKGKKSQLVTQRPSKLIARSPR
ncbi:uncharacterized protein HD556DRAFT_1445858 [Suillus plorans]|uniref:Uncharacterized protein n=1 Tax=Suillus plorans TaxID=116603 RepID=A0A9P7AJJ7_9AGAM|nr:uncharacterized protein HD556DRAFT_1445858 [Suillus plorans]KAG1790839.1 hypothetical protein HD556DRAFT_1445858 [Suillus plorans]